MVLEKLIFTNKLNEEEMRDHQQKLYKTSIFLTKLLVIGLFFRILIWVLPSTLGLQAGYAAALTSMINLLGVEAFHRGIDIYINDSIYRIIQDCLGWKSMVMYIGLTFASAGDREYKKILKYLLAGLILIQIGNIVRILTTIYLAESGIISFEIIHGIFWTWGLAALILIIWLYQERK